MCWTFMVTQGPLKDTFVTCANFKAVYISGESSHYGKIFLSYFIFYHIYDLLSLFRLTPCSVWFALKDCSHTDTSQVDSVHFL